MDGLLARFPDLAGLAEAGGGDPDRPGIVHRLDKGTSGLLVVARTPESLPLTVPAVPGPHGGPRLPRARGRAWWSPTRAPSTPPSGARTRQRTRMAVTARGRQARTAYRVVARFSGPVPCTLLEASLDTGRTHQVRVHLAAIGHPVIGDERYGRGPARPRSITAHMPPGRMFLHAFRLSLDHPSGERATWEAPLPADLDAVLGAPGELSGAVRRPGGPPRPRPTWPAAAAPGPRPDGPGVRRCRVARRWPAGTSGVPSSSP